MSIYVRKGGIDTGQRHNDWLSTVSQSPNVVSMSFVPITSLLGGVHGNGFLIHAVNLYLRCKFPGFKFSTGLFNCRDLVENDDSQEP